MNKPSIAQNKRICRTRYRGKRGAIAFGVVLALILVMLGVGFMVLVLYMGGQHETKNAVDAGALNIGKQIIDNASTRLGLGFLDEKQRIFYDVLADDPYKLIPDLKVKASLRNINRVWGKALLIGINADAAEKDGNAGSATANAKSAIEGAEALSNDLQKDVVDSKNWRGWFDDIAKLNSVRMLGQDAAMKPINVDQWQNSCMMRGAESNIELFGDAPNFNLPPGYQLSEDAYTSSTRESKVAGAGGRHFLKGYTPITVAGKTIWQIPFPYDEKTHLVSGPEFVKDKPANKPLSWAKPIPNAFSAEGASVKTGGGPGEHATSYVITNPHQSFRLSIPHSFLKIHVEKPKTHWKFLPYVDWVEFGDPQEYDFSGKQSQTGPTMPLGGVGCTTSSAGEVDGIGLDVTLRTLDMLMFPPEFKIGDNDMSQLEGYMVNRINEMVSDAGTAKTPPKALTADDLHDCLNNPLTILYLRKGIQDFYIFSKDGKTITCQPEEIASTPFMAPWLRTDMNMIANDPDGTEKKIIDDANIPFVVDGNPSSVPLQIPIPFSNFLDIDWATWDENVYWTPGSGYNGCLGTVRLERYTEIHTLSICVPL